MLGEEVPAALQHLKDRVRLANARMKELRLTEGEVVRAAQRIPVPSVSSDSLITPTQHQTHTSIEPHPTHPHPTTVNPPKPKLTLSRSQTLADKTQLTLVGLTQCASTPATSPLPDLDKPPSQTSSLDKAHLLALWRCALPVARIEEVLAILEVVFTQREAQVAKAALSHSSRHHRHSTPPHRQTRALRTNTNTTPWKARTPNHTPATPHRDTHQPATPHRDTHQLTTPHRDTHQPATPHSASWCCDAPHSDCSESATPHSNQCKARTTHSELHPIYTIEDDSPPPNTHHLTTDQGRGKETLCSPTTNHSDTRKAGVEVSNDVLVVVSNYNNDNKRFINRAVMD